VTALLVAGPLAAALVLVTGTGLMLRALWTLYQRGVGIDIARLLVLDVTVPDVRMRGGAAAAQDVARMTERLSAVPGALWSDVAPGRRPFARAGGAYRARRYTGCRSPPWTLKIAAGGVAAGAGAAALLSRQLGSSLHGIGVFDPLTFASAAAVLVSLALLASYVPARCASRIDPVSVIRSE
jgi:hypothetical protein